MARNKRVLAGVVALAILIAVVAAGAWGFGAKAGNEKGGGLGVAVEVMALVKTQYVDKISLLDLVSGYAQAGTINGMLRNVVPDDPYTRYLTPAAFKDMQIETKGTFGGIGIYLGMQDNQLTVIAPIKGTPAERVGIKPLDRIKTIDGRSTKDMSSDEAVRIMRGPRGTTVELGVERGAEKQQLNFKIVRDIIRVPSVDGKMVDQKDKIGYVKLDLFSDTTVNDLDKALDSLDAEGMRALILDLRFNPGGVLPGAIGVVNEFVKKGPILHVVGRNGVKESIMTDGSARRASIPMAVLVNKASASASEIVSGSLKDDGRAVLIGTTTFGKGLVQTVYSLSDGSGLLITTQRYLTAGGHAIHKKGVTPDIVIRNPGDAEMEEALTREQQGKPAATPPTVTPAEKDKEKADKEKKPEKQSAATAADQTDYQLNKAIEVLKLQLSKDTGNAAA